MRQNKMLLPTLREVPKEAEVKSHRLMLRAGLIRQLASGVYTYLPLGLRVLKKVERIVREEMDLAGAQEILCSALQPAELWHTTGRFDDYGPELIKLKDRHERDFVLGPTHEEVFTTLIEQEINSYKKLPINVYQIQTKYRDERRPRFGLMRSREFLMKDAYSFHDSWPSLNETYDVMYDTYNRIFQRIGLNFRPVLADAGAIGGTGRNNEFMALAEVGEDTLAVCSHCDYAANLEKAEAREYAAAGLAPTDVPSMEEVHTPNTRTIEQLVASLGIQAADIIKTMVYRVDDRLVAVVLRGDHDVNELKLAKHFNAREVELADEKTVANAGLLHGFIGPVGLAKQVQADNFAVVVDREVAQMAHGYAGANKADYHSKYVVPGRDFAIDDVADLRNVVEGDRCPNCEAGSLQFHRGIEIGHIFELGTKYSVPIGATFLDQEQKQQPFIMGCYGIGVSRVITALIEQSNDDNGIIWPLSVAPYQVHLIPINVKDADQMRVAEELYRRLQQQGVEVLLDDRDERAGVKFKDADLIGLPVRVTVGKRVGEGVVEFSMRQAGEKTEISLEQAYEQILGLVRENEGQSL